MSTKRSHKISLSDEEMKRDTKPRLLTRAQAAAYCGISASAFSNWVKSGKLPKSIGGTARWDIRAIDAMLDQASNLCENGEANALDIWRQTRARAP